MKIKFVGAIERVTGSCTWLKYEKTGLEFLVDCGMIQGDFNNCFENNQEFPFNPKKLKFVLLTHAHLDHCGLIPRLYDEGFAGKIICTEATAKICREIILDAIKIGETPYKRESLAKIKFEYFDRKESFKFGPPISIDKDFQIYFLRSSHILGAVSIGICWRNNKHEQKSMLFTGDLGNNTEENSYLPLLRERHKPYRSNYVMVESTYGARKRVNSEKSFENRTSFLEQEIIDTIYKKQGNLIIPTFTMQRTQEILFDLYFVLKHLLKAELENSYPIQFREVPKRFSIKQFSELIKNNPLLNEKDRAFLKDCYRIVFDRLNKNETEKISKEFENPEQIRSYLAKGGKQLIDEEQIEENAIQKLIKLHQQNGGKDRVRYSLKKDLTIEQTIILKSIFSKPFPKHRIRVIWDSPLGKKISSIFAEELNRKILANGEWKYLCRNKNLKELLELDTEEEVTKILGALFSGEEVQCGEHTIQFINSTKSSGIETSEPTIILTSSGMCEGGPVVKHLIKYYEENKNTILLTGFQSKGTNGHKLHQLTDTTEEEKKEKTLKIKLMNGDEKQISLNSIKAEIKEIRGYSGHADQQSLLDYLFIEDENSQYVAAPTIFINHGDDNSKETLQEKIIERSSSIIATKENKEEKNSLKTKVIIPTSQNEWYDLNKDEWKQSSKVEWNELNENKSISELFSALKGLATEVFSLKEEVKKLSKKF